MQAYQFIRKTIPYQFTGKDDYESSSSSHNEEDATLLHPELRKRKTCNKHIFYYIFVSLASILIGLFAEQFFRVERNVDGFTEPYGHVARIIDKGWSEQKVYMDDMNRQGEDAWEDLLPDGYGLVQHRKLAPAGKVISAFHEIHCLHSIRKAYSVANYQHERLDHMINTYLPSPPWSHNTAKKPISDFAANPYIEKFYVDTGRRPDPQYVKHCFEYLRQALMCAADSNLEDVHIDETCVKNKDDKIGEIFKVQSRTTTPRICRDYDALKNWSEKWQWDGDKED